eukprot:CAMPEP_0202962920 /NCGR_PEP_ID=MMETSP1396-20130829/6943_1 /ASSEMBLY_ACC=CAM_ASM_000872 /TAXON_ID= /ORGANISM="Pseudokeronopsis sp., Strain Brazil" /LENGTH=78 /DNA_ID=CAMNT_0049683759 /DNA_START=818 /DNA_END=1054 /DNA_ORIENTATION=-
MVANQQEKPIPRLLKHIIRCYARLSENPRALMALKENLPLIAKDQKFMNVVDEGSKKCLKTLCENLNSSSTTPATSTD